MSVFDNCLLLPPGDFYLTGDIIVKWPFYKLLIVPRRYFCRGSNCYKYVLEFDFGLFAPYVLYIFIYLAKFG